MKFTIKFKTMGLTFFAGEVEADRLDNAKSRAAELLANRNVKSIEYAAILNPDFTEAALLNTARYNMPTRHIEWLTIRK